ncbi:hypothetical protein Pmani_029212 [Petrolisthes manimaculis]|uniref:Uncharacterized protein n=2 Tax=Petrolisthes manimaculis TaxID=1843537 RepID=A0AAE1NZT3_9EUCA|nr:hypothetical protein Pmani_029212 [Petrolisthes manimaculis]
MRVRIHINSKEDRQAVAIIYRDLTKQDLLGRCIKGKTQNVNESFHSKLWKKSMKVKFHGHKKVKFAFLMSALEHNTGYKSGCLLYKILGGVHDARGLEIQEQLRLLGSAKKTVERRKRKKTTEDYTSDYVPGGY